MHDARADVLALERMRARCFLHEALCKLGVDVVLHRHVQLLPDEREVAAVVVDRLVEDRAVGDGDDAPRVLPCLHPHRHRRVVVSGGLTHLEDRRTQETQRDHVTAHTAHHNAVTDGEDVAAQDQEVAGERRDGLLHRERQRGGEHTDGRRRVQPVVEPDRDQPERDNDRRREVDPLAAPEPPARVFATTQDEADEDAGDPAQ